MTAAYFEEHPTDPDKVIMRKPPHDIDLFWRAATTPEKWVGLTAEEVLQCWEKAHEPGNKEHINAIRMADEVEAKLKEKNCG